MSRHSRMLPAQQPTYLGHPLLLVPPFVEGPEGHHFHHLAVEIALHDRLELLENYQQDPIHRGLVRVLLTWYIAWWWHGGVELGQGRPVLPTAWATVAQGERTPVGGQVYKLQSS